MLLTVTSKATSWHQAPYYDTKHAISLQLAANNIEMYVCVCVGTVAPDGQRPRMTACKMSLTSLGRKQRA